MKARTRSRASRIWGVIASSCMAASGHLDRAAASYAASSRRMRGDGGTDARGRERHPADRGGGRRHGGGAAAAAGAVDPAGAGRSHFVDDPGRIRVLPRPADRAGADPAAAAVRGRLSDLVAGLPGWIVTVLEGESLFNDATALVAYRVAVAAAVSGVFSPAELSWRFALASVGGAVVGLAVALAVDWLRRRIDDPIIDNTMSLVAPFAAYLPAEVIGASGVLAVVVTGLYLGYQAPVTMTAASRLVSKSVWKVVEFLLQGTVFTLIGLQLREVLAGLRGYDPAVVVVAALAVAGAVVGVRFVWMFPVAYGTRLLARSREDTAPRSWREPLVVSWAGMRGVVSLAAAFALPLTVRSGAPFPQRDLLLFLTFVIIGVTLVGQGVTMPALIRRLAIPGPDPTTDALQEASAQQQAASAALERLEALLRSERVPPGVAEQLRQRAEGRTLAAWERLGSPSTGAEGFPTPSAAYRRLRREMLAAEREVLVRLRDNGRLDEEVQRRIQWELDLEEATLLRE